MSTQTPIHVSYAGKLLKSRTRDRLKTFVYRFYTPYVFLIWMVIAFDYNNCNNIPPIMIIIILLSAFQNSKYSYDQWYADILLMTEANDTKIPGNIKISIASSDFIVQVFCTILSFWWIDDLHTCIPLGRTNQGIAWTCLLIISILAHTLHYRLKNEKLEYITRNAYKHVQSSSSV